VNRPLFLSAAMAYIQGDSSQSDLAGML